MLEICKRFQKRYQRCDYKKLSKCKEFQKVIKMWGVTKKLPKM